MVAHFKHLKWMFFFIVLLSMKAFAAQDIKLDISSLDKAWNNRESKEGQESILNFLKKYPKVPENYDVAWRVARLAYFCGNFGIGEKLDNDTQIDIFSYGYKAGEVAKTLQPKKVEGYYWYAVDLGSFGLAKGVFSALSNAPEGRDALLKVISIDPTYQWGGAYRVLGRYYQELPKFISFGNKKIAAQYYNKAIMIEPNFVLNTMYLGVLMSKLGDDEQALKLLNEAKKMKDLDGEMESARYHRELDEHIKRIASRR